ncbi:MAG: hypothetical protein M3457_21925 [Chloroflexota bacterium]|nr:hypothetical protein [Chloroflexota bacterium]
MVSERGGTNPKRLTVMMPSASWQLSSAGLFSAFVRLDDLQDAGIPQDCKGSWLEWASPAGDWGGIVTGRPITDGVCEIAAMSWAVLLRGRVMDALVRPVSGPPGALMRKVLQEATRDEPTFLTIGTLDEDGESMQLSYGAEDVYNDILPMLAGDSGHEWRVTPERVFHFGRYVGTDLSASVRLVEDRHIASYRASDDLWTISNRLIGTSAADEMESKLMKKVEYRRERAKNPRYKRGEKGKRGKKYIKVRQKYTSQVWKEQVDPFTSMVTGEIDTIQRYGPLELVRDYPDTRDRGTIEARLARELAELSNPPIAMELSLVNVDDCYRRFVEGDVVWIDIGSAGLSGAFRVKNRSLDSGGLRIAGDLRPMGRN